jgi:Helix-turn-helix domain
VNVAQYVCHVSESVGEVYSSWSSPHDTLLARTSSRPGALQEEGTTFRDLLSEARSRHACELLAGTDLTIEAIAGRLGYQNPANFSRAFGRAAGKTPSQYRARMKGPGS